MEGVTPKKEKWEHHLLHFNAIMVTNVESIMLTSELVSRVTKGWTAEDLQAFSAASGEKQLLANKYLLELHNKDDRGNQCKTISKYVVAFYTRVHFLSLKEKLYLRSQMHIEKACTENGQRSHP